MGVPPSVLVEVRLAWDEDSNEERLTVAVATDD